MDPWSTNKERPECQKDQPKTLPPGIPPPPQARACGRQQSRGPADRVWGPRVSTDGRAPGTGLPGARTRPHADYNYGKQLWGPVHAVPVLTRSMCEVSSTCPHGHARCSRTGSAAL